MAGFIEELLTSSADTIAVKVSDSTKTYSRGAGVVVKAGTASLAAGDASNFRFIHIVAVGNDAPTSDGSILVWTRTDAEYPTTAYTNAAAGDPVKLGSDGAFAKADTSGDIEVGEVTKVSGTTMWIRLWDVSATHA